MEETEAKVYMALLELGPATVSEITKKAGITRTLGYHVLEKLGWYGLVDQVSGKGAKIVYSAEHPQRLVQHIKNRKNQWQRTLEKVEDRLPELVSLYKIADKPTIRYQEGIEGVKGIYLETLESKTEILSIMDAEGWNAQEFRSWARKYNRERGERKIRERILLLDTPVAQAWLNDYQGSFKYTEYRWIRKEQLKGIELLGGEINIFENKVVMALLKEPNRMGVHIESDALSNILKALFELTWENSLADEK
ncbi:MAG TPA: helix-turn-helix domain-containing protein [Candidatus Fimivivens sp.]|nr:helix-turn-helix domain-containing protein [Candidatus Fimivivens sp.]